MQVPPARGKTAVVPPVTFGSFWVEMNRSTIRLVAWTALPAAVVDFALYLILGQAFFLTLTVVGLLIGMVAVWQIGIGSDDAVVTLAATAVALTMVGFSASAELAFVLWGTLPVIGSIGALMTPGRWRAWFVTLIGVLLALQALLPVLGIASVADTAIALVATSASALPTNTDQPRPALPAATPNVASCVLSPSSARNTVTKIAARCCMDTLLKGSRTTR